MSEFRGPLPLDDRDFSEVRGKVLSKIERRPIAIPITLAAAAVIACIIFLMPQPQILMPPPHRPPVVVVPMPPAARVEQPVPVKIARREPTHKPERTGAPPADTEITMNIETADPNVRIIWISR